MIGEATTGESSPTGIDGDDFDISSLRGEDFSSGINDIGGEVNAGTSDAASSLDLVAVASGEERLDTTMSDTNSNNSSEISTPVDPDLCEKFGTIACVGCVFAQACRDRQAAMMDSNNEDQPEEQLSTLEKLLREDEDEEPGNIVWAQPTPDDTSREQPPAAEKEQSINDSSSVFEPEPKPKPEPEEKQPLSDTQPSPRLSNKQKEAAAALPQATDDGSANLEANSNLAVKASKEPHAQIDSDNTNERIKQDELPRAVDHATTRSQKEPVIEKVSSTLIDANDTLADSGTSTAIDREDSTQEPPVLKSKSISTNNNLLKKTAPKNITTRPNSDSSTDFEVSAEMSLEDKKNPSIGKQNPLADDKKDNISSPSAVESVDYSRKTLPETRSVNAVQNTSDGEDSAVKLVEKESAPSKKAVVKNHNTHYSDSASVFNQIEQVETVANTPAVKLPVETASWASENEIFVVDREETFANNHRDESMQREAVLIDSDNDLPTLPQNELTPKVDIEQDLEQKNTTEINIQLRSDRSSELLPKLDEMVNSVLPPSMSLNYELLPKPDETSSGLQEHDERQISELWPKPDEASNQLIDQADFEDDKPVRQKAQQIRITQPNENDTIYVDLRNEHASSEVDSLHSQPTADYADQIEMNNDNDLNCQLNDNSGSQAEKLYEVAFAHPLAALWTDDSRLNPENNKISKGSSTSVTSWLTKLVGAVAVYVACSRREGTLGISN